MQLAKGELVRLLKELAAALPTFKDRNLEALAAGYYDALSDCPFPSVDYAMKRIRREDSRFPSAARIRQLALEHMKQSPNREQGPPTAALAYFRWEQGGMNGPCPVCGSVMEWPEGGRGRVKHDHQRHYEFRIGYSGPSTGPVDYNRDGTAVMKPSNWQPPEKQPELALPPASISEGAHA